MHRQVCCPLYGNKRQKAFPLIKAQLATLLFAAESTGWGRVSCENSKTLLKGTVFPSQKIAFLGGADSRERMGEWRQE